MSEGRTPLDAFCYVFEQGTIYHDLGNCLTKLSYNDHKQLTCTFRQYL